jgi:capsular exopolysaccharide synthesis family protein
MEHIRQAVDRAKALGASAAPTLAGDGATRAEWRPRPGNSNTQSVERGFRQVQLDQRRLESRRIVAHDVANPDSKPFDMLRTLVLQAMDKRGWQFVAITSPNPGCGKSVTAINLALSIARQPDRSVLLLDMDLQRPQVANYLGIGCKQGLLGMLAGEASLRDALTEARAGDYRMLVLPAEAPAANSSEWLASRSMTAMIQALRTDYRNSIVLVDLPPVLPSDDVIAVLPHMDAVLLVTAAGASTQSEISECRKHLEETNILRIVVNKLPKTSMKYSY